jgi:hypothetical protein
MVRTATAIAALSLSLGLGLSLSASAEPLNSPIQLTGPMDAVREGGTPSDGGPDLRVSEETPTGTPLLNQQNGKPVTVEMVQTDVKWREQTAETLKQDGTSGAPR